MSAVDITKDLENATLVVTGVFAAPPARVWRLWADPRQLYDVHTRMRITTVYDTSADLEQVLAMGMEEGIRTAVGQIDALLAEG